MLMTSIDDSHLGKILCGRGGGLFWKAEAFSRLSGLARDPGVRDPLSTGLEPFSYMEADMTPVVAILIGLALLGCPEFLNRTPWVGVLWLAGSELIALGDRWTFRPVSRKKPKAKHQKLLKAQFRGKLEIEEPSYQLWTISSLDPILFKVPIAALRLLMNQANVICLKSQVMLQSFSNS